MTKKIFIAAISLICMYSCARKTVPPKPNTVLQRIFNDTSKNNNNSGNVFADDSVATTATSSSALVMVIADGYGRLITPQKNLPQDAAISYNSLQLSKGFTTQQRANLEARYKTVPPRVLYVPQQYVSSSLKGSYYIYIKKFWYWKKADGLFYIDEKYYL